MALPKQKSLCAYTKHHSSSLVFTKLAQTREQIYKRLHIIITSQVLDVRLIVYLSTYLSIYISSDTAQKLTVLSIVVHSSCA